MGLDSRKQRVLQAIVDDYIATAEPVGSRTIARKYRLGVSSATIRNEMSDLEEMGYLEQPHTSAGRVPSDLGYRFYVDRLMAPFSLSPDQVERVVRMYRTRVREIEHLVQATARVLSESTSYLALVLGPQFGQAQVQSIHLLPISESQAMLVLVTSAAFSGHKFIEIPPGTQPDDLLHISRTLNTALAGLTLDEVNAAAWRELNQELRRYRTVVEQVVYVLEQMGIDEGTERMYTGGTTNILALPEFRDVEKARTVLGILEDARHVHELLHTDQAGLTISIGEENRLAEAKECSVVSATYQVGDKASGRIAVLGPRRMNYAQVVSIVRLVEKILSESLARSVC
ncbi:MAG: heat-inducible transcriptional repressor HrcA [Bacillota bacterium]